MSIENQHTYVSNYYLAIPLPKPILEDWQRLRYYCDPRSSIPEIITNMKKLPHITLKFFKKMPISKIPEFDFVVFSNLHNLNGATVQIDGLTIIGQNKKDKAFVGLVKCSENILNFVNKLDEQFLTDQKFPFLPHITIREVRTNFLLKMAQEVICQMGDYKSNLAKIEGLYSKYKGNYFIEYQNL